MLEPRYHNSHVDEPSPPQVKVDDPTMPKPSVHVKVHTLPKLLLLVQVGSFPLAGVARVGQVMAV